VRKTKLLIFHNPQIVKNGRIVFISGSRKGLVHGCSFASDEIENTPKLVLAVPNSPIFIAFSLAPRVFASFAFA